MENKRIIGKSIYREEENLIYGSRKVEIGLCFKAEDNHYYMQRKNDVIHINPTSSIINDLHPGYLNNSLRNLEPVSNEEFESKMKETIYNLDICKYWESIES
jgi:hypothetical protein